MRPKRSPRAHERGFVLLIVLVVGVAAGLAAVSLTLTRGGAELAAMHTEVGDRSQVIAEAGMQRAVFYLNDMIATTVDFDAVLDVGLNKACGGQGSPLPDDDDLRPPLGSNPMEWNDAGATMETIGTKNYSCVPFNGGRYCVHFEDDDDDDVTTDEWEMGTGNNEDGAGGCDNNGCLEGNSGSLGTCDPAADPSPSHNDGEHNGLRDRNRTIWVIAVGIYPDVDFADATHKTTLRRMHMAPRPPANAGLSIRGNVTMSGAAEWFACSDVAGVEIDGTVDMNNSGCSSGMSTADSWTDAEECVNTTDCQGVAWDGMTAINPVGGGHFTPGPNLPDMPDPWDDANEHVDFDRECIFWLDWGGTNSLDAVNVNIDSQQLWWWDADEDRGPNGARCGDFETLVNDPRARMPGPPNPSRAGQAGSLTDPADWAGCWSPLLIDMGAATVYPTALVSPMPSAPAATPIQFTSDAVDCWTPPYHNGGVPIVPERPLGASCSWRPSSTAGTYTECDTDGNGCTSLGDFGTAANLGGTVGPVNQRLLNEGFTAGYPPGTRLSKPDWRTCTVEYPPPGTIVAGATVTPQQWGCTTCNGLNSVLQVVGAGPWFRLANTNAVRAVPAGVYFITGSTGDTVPGALTGASYDWGANALDSDAAPATPWDRLGDWPLTTVMTDGNLRLQRPGFTWGIGQSHPGEANDRRESRWARSASWIVGGLLELQGGGNSATAGSVYAASGSVWSGNGDYHCFGQLYSDGSFSLTGTAAFYWLYQVDLSANLAVGAAGVMPTQTFVAQ